MTRLSLAGAVAMAALGVSSANAEAPKGPEEKLSPAQIKATVDSHVADIKECIKGQTVGGKLVVQFGVMPSGKTEDVKVKEASANAAVDKCVAAAFRKFSFPKRNAGPFQGVEYPLIFSAAKPAGPPKGDPEEQKAIEQVVVSHMPEVRRCYEDGLIDKADLQGVLNTAIVIAPAGKVAETKIVDNTVGAPKVEKCITDAIQQWEFPKHTGNQNVTINYPFVLKRENKK
jgi:TonB family protein